MKAKILVFLHTYLPGYKSGGPVRSVSNLVESLGNQFDFSIVTSDRDAGESPYPGLCAGSWTEVGRARVLYLPPDRLGFRSIFHLLKAERADCLYLNSFFGRPFSIFPMIARATGARGQKKVILAPRGEFSTGALNLHRLRKRAWIAFARRNRVYKTALWHASSAFEKGDIRRVMGDCVQVFVSSPLTSPDHGRQTFDPREGEPKVPGQLKVVFLSRICEKKNLLGALDMIGAVRGDVAFDIYGPKEDEHYWEACQALIERMPSNVQVRYRGIVRNEEVQAVFSQYDIFLLPTLGENFGHVIAESLMAGCPVLLSDQTPWRGLQEARAGWDLALDKPGAFVEALQEYVDMGAAEHRVRRTAAREFAIRQVVEDQALEQSRQLFLTALESGDNRNET